ncbi:MAG: ABC transporter permease [Thermotoga sp.]|nr:MAG: ABC transporter permease [Thermotoga sp.]
MLKYIIRRIIVAIPVLIGVSVLCFIIIQMAPGDFLDQLRINPAISKETIDKMTHQFGLDKPVVEQYFMWLKSAVTGNFGYSYSYRRPVSSLIWSRAYNTFILAITSLIFSWIIGIGLGIFSALHKYTAADHILTVLAFIGLATPAFFLGLILLYFAARTGTFPITGMTSVNHEHMTTIGKIVDILKHLFLPMLALGLIRLVGIMRQMRGQLLDVMHEDYVLFAVAKGMPRNVVIYKHALRNAINPLITMFGYALASLLSGALIIEIIFSWPGLGRLIYNALLEQDVYLVMGSLLISSAMLIGGNLVADILLAWADPRVRLR